MLLFNGKLTTLLIVTAISCYLLILISNIATRAPWVDEGLVANPAWNLAINGSTGTTCIETRGSQWTRVDKHTYNTLPLGILNLALWYKLFGFSLTTTRLPSLFWATVLLISIYFFLRLHGANRALAAVSVILTAIDYNFMIAATFARVDMMCAAIGISALASFSLLRLNRPKWAVLFSSFLVMLSLLTHPNGVVFVPAVLLVELLAFRWSLSWKTAVLALLPVLTVGACWFAYLVLDWDAALDQLHSNTYPGRLTGFLHPLLAIRSELLDRYLTAFGLTLGEHPSGPLRARSIVLVAYLSGLVSILWITHLRHFRLVRLVVALLSLVSVYLTFFDGTRFTYYMVLVTPWWCTLLGVILLHLWTSCRKAFAAIVITFLAVLQTGGVLYRSAQNPYRNDLVPAVSFLQSHASKEDLVFANTDFAMAYGFDRNVKAEISLGYRSNIDPEYIVIDPNALWQMRSWRGLEPSVYRYMVARLHIYRLIYDQRGYQIYHKPQQAI